ncbi:MAG: hypothetical protein L3J83_09375 [Proteobacteria bacterium]|nr:hypothetical protein [Pseudomonadota bacterium]
MKNIDVEAKERVRVIHMFSNSLPMDLGFSAISAQAGQRISGKVEVRGSNWLFPKEAVLQELGAENIVKKGMWDTFYSVYVTPDIDVSIKIEKPSGVKIWLLLIIALIIVAIASSMFFSASK